MLNIIQTVQLPIGNFDKVVGREQFLGPDNIMLERMIGSLPALADSMEWARRINPPTQGYAGAEAPSPIKILTCVNGGTKDDVAEIQGYMQSLDFDWVFLHQDAGVESEARCIEVCVEECIEGHEFTALVPGHVTVREDKWFEKMQHVFRLDRNCGMVGTDTELMDNSSIPFRLPQRNHPTGPIVLLRRNLLSEIKWTLMPKDGFLPEEISKQVKAMYGNVWVAPSVRFIEQEWESPQQEKSATTIPSESPSSMTPN